MILYTAIKSITVERLAAEMVDLSMDRRESICAIREGIPLVTYPNDARERGTRIKNLVLAFMDSYLRSQMISYPIPAGQPCDTRFDPQFRCGICEISSSRAKMLEETLAALSNLIRRKMPEDKEIVDMADVITTILMGSSFGEMATSIGKRLKP